MDKTYSAPQLQKHGSLEQITQAGGNNNSGNTKPTGLGDGNGRNNNSVGSHSLTKPGRG
jgi:hypothetical protein